MTFVKRLRDEPQFPFRRTSPRARCDAVRKNSDSSCRLRAVPSRNWRRKDFWASSSDTRWCGLYVKKARAA